MAVELQKQKNTHVEKNRGVNERTIASQLHNRNVFEIQIMDTSYT